MLFDQRVHGGQFRMPAGCSHHHVLSGLGAGANVIENAVRSREVDDAVKRTESIASEPGSIGILRGTKGVDVVPALSCDLADQRTSPARAKKQQSHGYR